MKNMKHIIKKLIRAVFLCAAALLLVVPAVAQGGLDDAGLRLGGKVGFGSAHLTLNKETTLGDARSTFAIGGFGEYRVLSWFSANIGVEYTQNGGANLNPRMFYFNGSPMLSIPYPDLDGSASIIRTDLRIHSLEFPVTARLSIPEQSGFKPFLMAGVAVGVNLGAKITNYRMYDFSIDGDKPFNNMVTASSDNVKDKISPANFSLLWGVGSEFEAFGKIFEFGVTYRLGLVNQNHYFNSLYQQYGANTFMGYVAVKFR